MQGDRCLEVVNGPLVERGLKRMVLRGGLSHDSLPTFSAQGVQWISIVFTSHIP
jgi:hypothetical protein